MTTITEKLLSWQTVACPICKRPLAEVRGIIGEVRDWCRHCKKMCRYNLTTREYVLEPPPSNSTSQLVTVAS